MSDKNSGFRDEAVAVALFVAVAIITASLIKGGSLSPFGGGAVGWVGKLVSANLAWGLGVCSFLIPAGCVYFGVRVFFSKISGKEAAKDLAAMAGLLFSSCLLATTLLEGVFTGYLSEYGAGGKLGGLIFKFTQNSFGTFGSYVIALSVMTVCLAFLAKASLRSLFSLFFKTVIKLIAVKTSIVRKISGFIFSRALALVKAAASVTSGLAGKLGEKKKKPVISEERDKVAETFPPEKRKEDEDPKIVILNKRKEKNRTVFKSAANEKPENGNFKIPPIELLEKPDGKKAEIDREAAYRNARMIEEKLADFGVSGKVTEIKPGPVITLFEYKPAPGVRVSKISSLENDLAMSLSALSIRIISPIPGRDVVGIEVPNSDSETVFLRELIEDPGFSSNDSLLTIAMGKDISGKPYYTDLATAPHLMIAGTTGSGKSVLMNSLLASLFYKAGPDRLRLLMIDPKMLEFAIYENIPHLLHPIVTEPRKAIAALKWAVAEMENRYRILSGKNARNINDYNKEIEREEGADSAKILPYIVILIDELADLIMSAPSETRDTVIRIAQKARAAGIHLVVATQRPSADIVSGLLKANIPARISFLVSSKVDSRIVLDAHGAERLLGKGDMLFLKPGTNSLERIQGALITDREREKIVDFLKSQANPDFSEEVAEAINKPAEQESGDNGEQERDDIYKEALEIVREAGQVSISMLQRRLKIGYNRAATIVERMEREGIVGEHQGAGKPREVILPGDS